MTAEDLITYSKSDNIINNKINQAKQQKKKEKEE